MTVPLSITCEEARKTLAPVRRPVLLAGRIAQAREHVEGCGDCQLFFEGTAAGTRPGRDPNRDKAPAELRDRILATLAIEELLPRQKHQRSGLAKRLWQRRLVRWSAAFVAVSALAVIVVEGNRTPAVPSAGAAFVDDYLRRAVGQERIETSDPVRVGGWLARELGMPMRPLNVAGLELESAEICLLEGQRGAMLRYRIDGVEVTHYLVPRPGAKARQPAPGMGGADSDVVTPPLVTWSTASLEQALVGELDTETLLSLARASY